MPLLIFKMIMCIASVVTTNVANNTNALLLMEYVYGPRLQNVVYGKLQNVLLRKILITFWTSLLPHFSGRNMNLFYVEKHKKT